MATCVEDEKLIKEGYQALIERLGISGFIKFMELIESKRGNWAEEREKVLKKYNEMDIRELGELIKATVEKSKS